LNLSKAEPRVKVFLQILCRKRRSHSRTTGDTVRRSALEVGGGLCHPEPTLLVLPRGIFGRKRASLQRDQCRRSPSIRHPGESQAKAGVHASGGTVADRWIPAFGLVMKSAAAGGVARLAQNCRPLARPPHPSCFDKLSMRKLRMRLILLGDATKNAASC